MTAAGPPPERKAPPAGRRAPDRERAERDELHRLSRTLRAHSKSSHAMLRASDEVAYLTEVCRIIVEDCGHAMVWVGLAEDDPERTVRPVAHAGLDDGYLDTLRVTWADVERGRGPTGTCIRTGKIGACLNMQTDPCFAPWREAAARRGYASAIALPLLADGKAFGAITIYSSEPDPFSEDERLLLAELAADTAYGITALRAQRARHRAEEARDRAEEELRRALDRAAQVARFPEENPDPVLRMAGDLRLVYANPAARSLLAPLRLEVGRSAPAQLAEPARRATAQGRRLRAEVLCDERWYSMSFCPVGREINVYAQDVTDRKHAEKVLEESDRNKTEFLGVLAHELRNPLGPVWSSIRILERADPEGEQAARARAVLRRQVGHLSRLVDDLLDMARISSGKVELRRERLDLAAAVSQAGEDLRPLLEGRGIELRVEVPARKVWVDGDPTRLTQIVGNLLHNSAKFTRPGGKVELTLALDAAGAAEIQVRDSGIGMEPAVLARVFEPFVQEEQPLARPQGGLGLGLALVKRFAELHGGAVRAESAGPEQGAAFVVRLPTAAEGPAATPAPAPARPGRGRCVLVVDDNRDAADTLAQLLRMLGHTVEVAFDGQTALARAFSHPPDLVLCDIGLPGMSGYEVARALRADERFRGTELVALTGYAQPRDREAAAAAGFDRHVVKPVDPGEIERLVADPERAGAVPAAR